MKGVLAELTEAEFREVASAIRQGRLLPPWTAVGLQRYFSASMAEKLVGALTTVQGQGLGPQQVAFLFETLADERAAQTRLSETVDLVWTGPEMPATANRDTSVVVRELFNSAQTSVLVVGYAVYGGREVFAALAERMQACPAMKVRMFLNVHPDAAGTSTESEIVRRFAERFRQNDWPGERMPELFFDPRSLSKEPGTRASLHAKCIVVDSKVAFVGSANFTEAAQLKNIEVGVLIRDPAFAKRLEEHFLTLAEKGILRRIPLG